MIVTGVEAFPASTSNTCVLLDLCVMSDVSND
jgi:hypothetical protein